MKGKACFILPTYNERENVGSVVRGVFGECKALGVEATVLVVDDHSPDGTAVEVVKLQRSFPQLKLLQRPAKEGLGKAYVAGFKWALANTDCDVLFEMDADGSHHAAYLKDFFAKLAEGNDVVVGSRDMPGGRHEQSPLHRTLISYGANYLIKALLALPLTDVTSGYRAIRRGALEKLDLNAFRSNGYEFQLELLHKLHHSGARIGKTPIVFTPRARGRSKMTFGDMASFLWLALRLWLNRN